MGKHQNGLLLTILPFSPLRSQKAIDILMFLCNHVYLISMALFHVERNTYYCVLSRMSISAPCSYGYSCIVFTMHIHTYSIRFMCIMLYSCLLYHIHVYSVNSHSHVPI